MCERKETETVCQGISSESTFGEPLNCHLKREKTKVFEGFCLSRWGVDPWPGSSGDSRHRQDVRKSDFSLCPSLYFLCEADIWKVSSGRPAWIRQKQRLTEALTLTHTSPECLLSTFVCLTQKRDRGSLSCLRRVSYLTYLCGDCRWKLRHLNPSFTYSYNNCINLIQDLNCTRDWIQSWHGARQ